MNKLILTIFFCMITMVTLVGRADEIKPFCKDSDYYCTQATGFTNSSSGRYALFLYSNYPVEVNCFGPSNTDTYHGLAFTSDTLKALVTKFGTGRMKVETVICRNADISSCEYDHVIGSDTFNILVGSNGEYTADKKTRGQIDFTPYINNSNYESCNEFVRK